MSQCYDFQRWTMISLATIAITLTIGLVTLVNGQENESDCYHYLGHLIDEN